MSTSGINLDGDAAVVGGIHTDSHDVHNITNNTTNNVTNNNTTNYTTVHQAQKTFTEIQQDNEQQFIQAVYERLSKGTYTAEDQAEFGRLIMHLQIDPERADAIIAEAQRSAAALNQNKSGGFLSAQLLEEIYDAICSNNVEVLRRKYSALEKLAKSTFDNDVQFYYHMLRGSFYPEQTTVAMLKTDTDNYWQIFWTHVAHVKLGDMAKAEQLLNRLNAFNGQQGDIALLMAIDNLAEYEKKGHDPYNLERTKSCLAKAAEVGFSEVLYPLWYVVEDATNGVTATGEFKEFFATQTIRELMPMPDIPIDVIKASAPPVPTPPPPMPEAAKEPAKPKFNPQSASLNQMGGFNPLAAANSMGMGSATAMKSMPSMGNMGGFGNMQAPQMPGNAFGQAPQMPGNAFGQAPQMPGNAFGQAPQMPGNKVADKVSAPDSFDNHYGIILTDTNVLAQKYGTDRDTIIAIFSDFVENAEKQNMQWGFLDAADYYGHMTGNNWTDYSNLVSGFIQQYGLPAGPDLHLMIVGGADVIPLPQVDDPYCNGEKIPCTV